MRAGALYRARPPCRPSVSTERARPMDADVLRARIRGTLSQSCHDAAALRRAAAAGCDFAFLSPVFSPQSKPGDLRPTLGVAGLAALCASAPLPVVALGGIGPAEVGTLSSTWCTTGVLVDEGQEGTGTPWRGQPGH